MRQLSSRIHEPGGFGRVFFLRGRDLLGGRWGLSELSSRKDIRCGFRRVRQLSGRPNFRGGRVLHILCGRQDFGRRWVLSELSGRENFRGRVAVVHIVPGWVHRLTGRRRL